DIGSASENYGENMKAQAYDKLFDLRNNIGYIALPKMMNREDDPEFFTLLADKMIEFKETKALVIDIRDNGGGRRDIIRMLSSYFLSPSDDPWVANVARVRVDTVLNKDIEQMSGRGLYTYGSPAFDEADRKAIDDFMKDFVPNGKIKDEQFSDNYYMVLRSDYYPAAYYYDKPVYLLVNERTFSAASVMGSVFKGMGKVKLAGVTTDGSSGLSKSFALKNSQLIIRLSRMISFQRNGKTLDGNGTVPDIIMPRDTIQILGLEDTQFSKLIKYIDESAK
ncbi:MAG: S41 family peptidase, partial [Cyclobacteriaceae bacterium]